MSKNLTRKGLVFGAVIALGSTVIAGTPALAANEVTLTPSAGTSYSLISGETFTLTAATGSLIPSSSYARLKTKVTNNSSIAYTTGATQTGQTFSAGTGSQTSSTASVVIEGSGATAASAAITLSVAATAAGNFSVQSWLDDNGNDLIDSGEFASETRTVTFVKAADVTATTAITAPVEGDTTVSATVKFNDINNEQLPAANVGAYFTKGDGTALAANTTSSVVRFNSAWSATDYFKFTTAAVNALAKDSAVKVQPLYKVTGLAATDAASTIASAATATVVARKAATIVASASVSTTAKDTGAGTADSLLNSSFAVKAVVKDGATTPAVVANQAVTAVISTNASLTTTAPAKTLTVNGTSYSSASALPGQGSVAKLALTTNASGEAVVNLTTVGYAAGETVTVSFTTENLTASQVVVTQRAATYTASVNSQASVASVADNGTASVAVAVYDQFGGAPADKYDVTATLTSSNQATTAATAAGSNSNVALVGGKATISLVENGTGNGTNVYDLKVQERLSGSQYGTTVVTAVPFTVKIVDATALVAGVVTSSTGTQNSTTKVYEVAGPVALSLNDVKNADTRKIVETAPTVTNNQALAGTVTTASSATQAAVAIAGAPVTLSGAGLQFYSGSVYAANSLTVATDASGAWAANVTSNKAGKQTITVTSGSASATITVVFAAAAADTGSVLKIDAPATIVPGRTLTVKATLVDKYGNPVAVPNTSATSPTTSLTYSGPGFTTSAITQTLDADGQSTFRVLLGAADEGSATITFTYDADGTTATIEKKTVTATVVIGAAAVASATAAVSGSTGKFYVSATNAAAKKVVVKVAGKFFSSFTGTAAKKTVALKAPKGKHKVTVFVGGKLVTTKTITVK
ncbi:beta strand repeat-containing protein [Rhodoluna lacicola]|uniref:Uncharacterized protein n=1 Tax=Rhodoluna lacicola TaxID=529884 RepID=A0A060JDY0_9MICO|nr:hypothetical protein [Rhodoluna lacicola]AIC48066.1 hypothetical protein Rhola_00012740 [Rhodoluna lacicola]